MKISTLIAFVLTVAAATPVLARGGGGFGGGGMGGGMGGGFGGGGMGGMGGGFGGGMGGRNMGGMGGGGGMGGMGGMNIDLRNLGGTTVNNRTNTRTNTTVTPTNTRGTRTVAAGPTTPLNNNGRGQQIQLSNDYAILDSTSIFAQNRRALRDDVEERVIEPVVFRGASPVVRAAMIDDLGPLALLEVQQRDGSLASVYVRKGDTVEYNNAKVLDVTLAYLRLSRASTGEGSSTHFDIPIGRNLDGQVSGILPATLVNQSLDALGASQNQNNRGRAGRGGGNNNANYGGNYASGYNNYAGGLGAIVGGGMSAVSVTNSIVNPNLDPPLPPGSRDDVASRMAARRQNQLNTAAAAPAVAPTTAAPATRAGG